jgi:hypothetical protein
LRCTFRVLCFNNWEHMLNFIWNPPEIRPPWLKNTETTRTHYYHRPIRSRALEHVRMHNFWSPFQVQNDNFWTNTIFFHTFVLTCPHFFHFVWLLCSIPLIWTFSENCCPFRNGLKRRILSDMRYVMLFFTYIYKFYSLLIWYGLKALPVDIQVRIRLMGVYERS